VSSLADRPWQEYIEQYVTRDELADDFFEDVVTLVKIVAWRYPASLYSPFGVWDDHAYRAVATDVLMKQLESGHLEKLYGAKKLTIYSHLRRGIRWHLCEIIDSRSSSRKFYKRTQSALKIGSRFRRFGSPEGWGLAEWERPICPVDGTLLQERLEAVAVPRPPHWPWNGGNNGKGTLPAEDAVAAFLEAFLDRYGRPVSLEQLVQAARVHFDIYETMEGGWPEEYGEDGRLPRRSLRDESPTVETLQIDAERNDEDRDTLKEVVTEFFTSLSPDDRILVRELYLRRRKQKALVGPGQLKSTISNRKRRMDVLLRALPVQKYPPSLVKTVFVEVFEESLIHDSSFNNRAAAAAAGSGARAAAGGRS
jgi:hypothetical protein